MYHEFGASNNRSGWKYTYTGGELVESAESLLAEYQEKEKSERDKMSQMLQDRTRSPRDKEMQECEKNILEFGRIAEELQVFAHEFRRTPSREFHLSLGDVVFFRLM